MLSVLTPYEFLGDAIGCRRKRILISFVRALAYELFADASEGETNPEVVFLSWCKVLLPKGTFLNFLITSSLSWKQTVHPGM